MIENITERLDRVLPFLSVVMSTAVVISIGVVLFLVSDSSRTVDRLNQTGDISNCRARFANEREAVRAELEVSTAVLSASLAEGLALLVEEPQNDAEIERVRRSLPLLVVEVTEKADDLVDAVEAYDEVLDLPEDQFVKECRERFQ